MDAGGDGGWNLRKGRKCVILLSEGLMVFTSPATVGWTRLQSNIVMTPFFLKTGITRAPLMKRPLSWILTALSETELRASLSARQ